MRKHEKSLKITCRRRAIHKLFLCSSQVGYYANKPMESAVYFLHDVNFNFCGITGAISDRFLTNQGRCTSVIYNNINFTDVCMTSRMLHVRKWMWIYLLC